MKHTESNSSPALADDPKGKPAKPRNRQEAWRERNPLATWAHGATRSAIRRGLITPQPCEICGATAEAHHPDHTDPLRVQWLCRIHHKRLHAELRKGGIA